MFLFILGLILMLGAVIVLCLGSQNELVQEIVPSYGLIFEGEMSRVFLTTDTQFCPNQIQTFYDSVDIIFHDCETTPFKSGVHAHFTDLATLDEKTKKKMWLTHYADGDKPDAEEAVFAGYVAKGQVFNL